jgi:hypothetical protein
MTKISWTQLKQLIVGSNLPYSWAQDDNSYTVICANGPFEMVTVIPSIDPMNPDLMDFKANYQNNSSPSLRSNVVQVLGADSLTLCPFGAMLSPTAGTTTNCDIALPQTMVLRGGVFFSTNAVVGDWISISVVDKDNVLGYGGTPESPTILGTYVLSWFIMPGVENILEDVSISQSLPQGVYMRIAYTSVGTTAPTALINFISYVGTP